MSGWLGPQEWQAVAVSLRVAALATILSLPFAVAVALILARGRFRGRLILDGIVHLPLVLPPVVTGYILLMTLGRNTMLGGFLFEAFGLTLAFRWTGAAVAAAVMAFPLMVRAIRLAAEAVDPGLEEAARTLGATRLRVFATVTLPLIARGVLAAAVLGFAKALGEFGATITFAAAIPGQTRTIASAIYGLMQIPGDAPALWRLVLVSVVLAIGALALAELLGRRIAGGGANDPR